MDLVMTHCWAIDRILLMTQYRTNPAGNHKKKKVKATGIYFIIFACIGSGGVGFNDVWMYIDAPISSGKMKYGSFTLKSLIQSTKGACLSSTDSRRTQ